MKRQKTTYPSVFFRNVKRIGGRGGGQRTTIARQVHRIKKKPVYLKTLGHCMDFGIHMRSCWLQAARLTCKPCKSF